MLTKIKDNEYLETGNSHTFKEWEELNKPIIWRIVETFKEWEVRIDVAFGSIQLLKNGKPVSTGKYNCATKDGKVFAMDKYYYDMPGYLYFKADI